MWALWARPLWVSGEPLRPRWPAGYQARLRRPGNAVLSKTTHPLNIIDFTVVPGVGAPPPMRTPAAAGRRSERAGVSPDGAAVRPALEASVSSWFPTRSALGFVISSGGVAPVDRGDAMSTACELERGADWGNRGEGGVLFWTRGTMGVWLWPVVCGRPISPPSPSTAPF